MTKNILNGFTKPASLIKVAVGFVIAWFIFVVVLKPPSVAGCASQSDLIIAENNYVACQNELDNQYITFRSCIDKQSCFEHGWSRYLTKVDTDLNRYFYNLNSLRNAMSVDRTNSINELNSCRV